MRSHRSSARWHVAQRCLTQEERVITAPFHGLPPVSPALPSSRLFQLIWFSHVHWQWWCDLNIGLPNSISRFLGLKLRRLSVVIVAPKKWVLLLESSSIVMEPPQSSSMFWKVLKSPSMEWDAVTLIHLCSFFSFFFVVSSNPATSYHHSRVHVSISSV